MFNRATLCLVIWSGMILPSVARADTLLEYLVKEIRVSGTATQSIAIKNDRIMVKAAGGDHGLDLLYRHAPESVVMVDHGRRTLTTVDEQGVERINQQAQRAEPLLKGLGKQIAKLSPGQRQKLQELVGDRVSLDKMANPPEPAPPTRWVPTGRKKVAGFRCRKVRVMQGETPIAELCLADPAAMKISNKDADTMRALFKFYDRLAAKSQGLARQLGLTLPSVTALGVTGIPIEFIDLSGPDNGTMTLKRIDRSTVSEELMRLPATYKEAPLMPWF